MIKTAEVTIETEERTVLPSGRERRSTLMLCPACRRQVEMVTPEHAAWVAGVRPRTIYRWVEAGAIHFIEDRGHLLICLPALSGPQRG